jgi:hypothetical protein
MGDDFMRMAVRVTTASGDLSRASMWEKQAITGGKTGFG